MRLHSKCYYININEFASLVTGSDNKPINRNTLRNSGTAMNSKPPESFREKVQFYLIDSETATGKLIDGCILLLNFVACLLFVADTYDISAELKRFISLLDLAIVTFFIIEYAARIYGAPRRIAQVFEVYSIIDLLAILPTILPFVLPSLTVSMDVMKGLRVFKVLRIFRFLRYFDNPVFFFGKVTDQILKVLRLVLTVFIIFFTASGFFYHAENQVNSKVANFGDAFYFSVVTLTTVGFGDIVPVSSYGRWVTVFMILSGVLLIPWQVGLIAREWANLMVKRNVICPQCGLKYHDQDASHCKSCGSIIFQEFEG